MRRAPVNGEDVAGEIAGALVGLAVGEAPVQLDATAIDRDRHGAAVCIAAAVGAVDVVGADEGVDVQRGGCWGLRIPARSAASVTRLLRDRAAGYHHRRRDDRQTET